MPLSTLIIILLAAAIALLAGVFAGIVVSRRRELAQPAPDAAVSAALAADLAADRAAERDALVNAAVSAMRHERSESMRQSVDTLVSVASSKLGDQLAAGKDVIDREHTAVSSQVETLQTELRRVGDLVSTLQQERAEQNGRLSTGIEQAMAVTSALADTTQSLRDALASPKARGQWGERMAEDVLRLAGFVEDINYRRQTKLEGGGIPDYTFFLPQNHVVHMDVKFPIDNYLRWLEADNPADQEAFVKAFRRDVRQRIKELTDRSYIDPASTVDYLLLFIPNESVYGFLHEHDPQLIDAALGTKVVLCSPTSLFAVLAVIRQAVDNFLVVKRSDEILSGIGGLRDEWQKFGGTVEKVERGLQSAQKAVDDLKGPRSRQFEKKLATLETVRDGRLADAEDAQPELNLDVAALEDPKPLRQVV